MPRYFITRLTVEGFRGVNNESDPLDIRFRPETVNSVFAVNGIGKSSIFEAIYYSIFGTIPKLDVLPAQERPQDYFCNRFHTQKSATIALEFQPDDGGRSEEHTSELQSLMRISYAVFCLKKTTTTTYKKANAIHKSTKTHTSTQQSST